MNGPQSAQASRRAWRHSPGDLRSRCGVSRIHTIGVTWPASGARFDAMSMTDAPFESSTELTELRRSIDNIDAALIHLLAERFKFTQAVGRLKATTGLPASDPDREKVQIARLRALAEEAHLDPAFAEKFLNFIVAEVIHHHEQIASTGAIDTLQ